MRLLIRCRVAYPSIGTNSLLGRAHFHRLKGVVTSKAQQQQPLLHRTKMHSSSSPPSDTHLVIAMLQGAMVPAPEITLPAPYTCEVRQYEHTAAEQVAERIRDADIVTLSVLRLRADVLDAAVSPRLKMVGVVASGTDCVDLAACRRRGIVVANTPHCNTRAVAEHTLALYFDARRSVTLSHNLTRAGRWLTRSAADGPLAKVLHGPDGKPPRTCQTETLGIVGYGGVGQMVETVARGLGMRILVSGRKGQPDAPAGRTPFDTLIREATVIVLCLPQTPETAKLLSDAEFSVMRPDAIVINVSRAGVVDDRALIAALREGKIAGAATDVHPVEPAGPENSILLGPETAELNLVTTPHSAWVAEDTNRNYQRTLVENIHSWLTTGRAKFQVDL